MLYDYNEELGNIVARPGIEFVHCIGPTHYVGMRLHLDICNQ
jgi:hypothetical protein